MITIKHENDYNHPDDCISKKEKNISKNEKKKSQTCLQKLLFPHTILISKCSSNDAESAENRL